MISILKITKGNNFGKNVGGVTVLISAHCLVGWLVVLGLTAL